MRFKNLHTDQTAVNEVAGHQGCSKCTSPKLLDHFVIPMKLSTAACYVQTEINDLRRRQRAAIAPLTRLPAIFDQSRGAWSTDAVFQPHIAGAGTGPQGRVQGTLCG